MQSSCAFGFEARVTGTGPIPWTISSMELDITFSGSPIAKLTLPEIRTSMGGAAVNIDGQSVNIIDVGMFTCFIRSLLVDEDNMSFRLERGNCTVNFLGLTGNCNYRLDVPLRCVMGPRVVVRKIERHIDKNPHANPKRFTVTFDVHNPGPVEIFFGPAYYELRNDQGETIADLQGNFAIWRKVTQSQLEGKLRGDVEPSYEVRLVGRGVETPFWCDEAVKFIDSLIYLSEDDEEQLRVARARPQPEHS